MQQGNPEQAILDQARAELDRWSDGDVIGWAQSAADDITYFDNIAAHTLVDGAPALGEYLSALQGQVPAHEYEIVDPRVQVYGDVGILSLQYHAFSPDRDPLAVVKGTCVYRQIDGAWRMVHSHWSTGE